MGAGHFHMVLTEISLFSLKWLVTYTERPLATMHYFSLTQ